MFPTQSDEPIFFEQDNLLEDLLADCAALEGNEITEKGVKKRQRKTPSASQIQENNKNEGSSDSKKTVHRDIERQRRQEMSGLYSSLRSLLPLEYVKVMFWVLKNSTAAVVGAKLQFKLLGKRAISDHMHQAVNYIKDMQKKIDEMKIRRDKLKKLSSVAAAAIDAENPNSNISTNSPCCVKINLTRDGILEILISSSLNEESFPLSKVLADLFARGLTVITCVSTRGDRCSLHKLQIELSGTTSIDLSELQDRLVNLIKIA